MPSRNPRLSWRLLGCLILVAGGATGGAQAEGFRMGQAQFYPSFRMQIGANSNIFNRADIPEANLVQIADDYGDLEVPLVWVLPFRESLWEFGYTPGYRAYREHPDLDGPTHLVETDLELNFSSGSRFRAAGILQYDYLNTEFSEGEIAFNAADYRRTQGLLEYEHVFSPSHGFRVLLERDTLVFDKDQFATFTNYKYLDLTASYVAFLTDTLRLYVDALGSTNQQDRPAAAGADDHWTRGGGAVGVQREFDLKHRARFFLGYERVTFNLGDSDFSGFVGEFTYSRAFPNVLDIQAEVARRVNPSVFNVNNYYVTDIARVGLEYRPSSRIFFPFLLSYQRNGYPEEAQACIAGGDPIWVDDPTDPNVPPGQVLKCPDGRDPVLGPPFEESIGLLREDFLFLGQIGIGFQFSRSASLALTYEYLDRDSNMRQFDYNTRIITLEFRFGWSPDTDYI